MAGINIFLLLSLSSLSHLTSQTKLEDMRKITKLVQEKHHNEVFKSSKHSQGKMEEIGKFKQSVIGSTVNTFKFAG